MKEVYAVWVDNHYDYEDYEETILVICDTLEEAEKYKDYTGYFDYTDWYFQTIVRYEINIPVDRE